MITAMCDMVEGRLQRNPKWSGLRMDFAEMCDKVEGRHQGKPEVVGLRGVHTSQTKGCR